MSREIYLQFLAHISLGTSGFPRVRREFSVSAKARHIFGRRPKPRAAKRVTIKTWQKQETAPEKSLPPRVFSSFLNRSSIPDSPYQSSILDPDFPVNFEVLLIMIILFFSTT